MFMDFPANINIISVSLNCRHLNIPLNLFLIWEYGGTFSLTDLNFGYYFSHVEGIYESQSNKEKFEIFISLLLQVVAKKRLQKIRGESFGVRTEVEI